MHNKSALLAAAMLVAASTVHAEISQCTVISTVPTTITDAGSYCLNGDLLSTVTGSSAAITIAADYVTLDLNGHTMTGPGGANAGVAVYAIAHKGLHVRNGTLRAFGRGVFITDSLVGFPPILPSGASTRHEIDNLRVEGAAIGISVLGHFSSVHDNAVFDATAYGISTGSSYVAGSTGAINVRGNQVFNTVAPTGGTSAAFAISAGGTGSVVQDNVITTVRGPSGSAAIFAGGVATIVSRNRETDLGSAWSVYCPPSSTTSPARVEGNINYLANSNFNTGIYNCSQPTGPSGNDNY